MTKPTLHMIGLFHTVPNLAYSHCAFTGKVLRFPKMMKPYGYNVIEYANGYSESEADLKVMILTEEELNLRTKVWLQAKEKIKDSPLKGDERYWEQIRVAKDLLKNPTEDSAELKFHGDTAAIGSPHWELFNERLIQRLKEHVKPGDVVCHPFGRSHANIVKMFPEQHHVETGIGYPDKPFGAFRIFETYGWMAYHQGRDGRGGNDYEFVVPNYFDLEHWPVRHDENCGEEWSGPDLVTNHKPNATGYILYFGRVCAEKGMAHIKAIAENIDEEIVVVGQGDLGGYAHPKLIKKPAVKGLERAKLLQGARCLLMPTRFVEPFGGAGVEGMLVGTPLIASNFGAFAETIEQGKTGFRCHTLGDWITAIEKVKDLSRTYTAARARSLYSLETCGARYDQIFQQIADLRGKGWYSKEGRLPVF